ncbi:MAG: HPF/RaiA family ribosome-associated protein [Acidimicrobiales bacterium]
MTITEPEDITITVHGNLPGGVVDYARDKVARLIDRVGQPVLYAEVELDQAPDPARERPAMVEVTLDVNGRPVRAHLAAGSMFEAIDLLEDRLASRLRRHEQRVGRAGRDLHRTGEHAAGQWRHGDLPDQRPEYFPLPYDERELVRTKSFALAPMTVDEAAFDLDQLGHDFYLFRELATDADAVVAYDEHDGALALQLPEGVGADPTDGAAAACRRLPPAPSLAPTEAIERLESSGERFVFFTDRATGRGSVVYHRYDGHWGLITAG